MKGETNLRAAATLCSVIVGTLWLVRAVLAFLPFSMLKHKIK